MGLRGGCGHAVRLSAAPGDETVLLGAAGAVDSETRSVGAKTVLCVTLPQFTPDVQRIVLAFRRCHRPSFSWPHL